MKSRTSFFNGTVLRKDITRFAPIWGVYGVICLLFLLGLSVDEDPARIGHNVVYLLPSMSFVNILYAGVCALFLFGDLFNSRLCNALHAMPLRRESWFVTHFAAGLLFCLVPNLLAACLSCIWLGTYSYLAFIWLAATALQFLFYFGVGAFSALCAGNRLGMLAVYGIINLLSLIVYVIVDSLFMPMLKGVMLEGELFEFLCPLVRLTSEEYLNVDFNYDRMELLWKGFVGQQWLYLGACAAMGLVFGALALVLYRKRNLEFAGDFLAVKWLQPVFLVIYSLGVAVICYEIGTEVGLDFVFLAVGLVLGYFTGRMLLERKVNVFKRKAFIGFAVLAVALAAAIGLTRLDPVGVSRYVPQQTQVESVRLFDQTVTSHAYRYIPGIDLTEPEELADITKVHRELVESAQPEYGMGITLVYHLKDGRVVRRYYEVNPNSTAGQTLKPYFSRWEYVFGTSAWERIKEQTAGIMINNYAGDRTLVIGGDWLLEDYKNYSNNYLLELVDNDVTPLTDLMEAIRKDCEEGNMAQNFAYTSDTDRDLGWIELHRMDNNVTSIRYTKDATHTLACLEKLFAQATAQ